MASCFECHNYKKDYGPSKSSYCKAWEAKLNDYDNKEGGREFAKYNTMGWSATKKCPYGVHDSDYDD